MNSPRGLDLPALSSYLQESLPGAVSGELTGRPISGGRSNLTYLIADGEHEWVLRRPPLGHVLETAHDMSREYRAMDGLRDTDVPVPPMLILCEDAGVLGAPFYLMEFVRGTIYRDRSQLAELGSEEADAVADGLVDALVKLHRVVPERVGLGDFGRPEGFLERQVRRWRKQLGSSRSRDIQPLEELGERLAATFPETRKNTLVHGDYRLDNVVMRAEEDGEVAAILDWEMSTLGDPLTDLASVVMWWDGIAGLDSPVAAVPGEFEAFPSSQRLIDRYAAQSDIELGDFGWYIGFAHYKVAAIFEGIHYRNVQGFTVGEGFDRIGAMVAPMVTRGHEVLSQVRSRA